MIKVALHQSVIYWLNLKPTCDFGGLFWGGGYGEVDDGWKVGGGGKMERGETF